MTDGDASPVRRSPGSQGLRDWLIAGFYVLVIFMTLPLIPDVWNTFRARAGTISEIVCPLIAGTGAALLLVFLIWVQRERRLGVYLRLGMIAVAFTATLKALALPIEELHLVEYGLLGVFLFRAVRHRASPGKAYLWGALAGAAVGLVDELIQGVVPNRYFGFHDVVVNGIGALLGSSVCRTLVRGSA